MIINQRPLSALKSEDTIEISSSSFVLSHSKFIISNFFCGRAMRKVTKHEHNSNWFYKLGFPNGFQTIFMLISWITWVRSLCMTRVEVAGDFFGKQISVTKARLIHE